MKTPEDKAREYVFRGLCEGSCKKLKWTPLICSQWREINRENSTCAQKWAKFEDFMAGLAIDVNTLKVNCYE